MGGLVSYVLFGGLVLYLVVGGIIFWGLEYEHQKEEQQKKEGTKSERISMLQDVDRLLTELQGNSTVDDDGTQRILQNLTDRIRDCINRLNESFANADRADPIWDIPGSIFFALTVVTTIGYGHLSPGTSGGQIFCCIYAVFGIPLCLIVLLRIGKKLNETTEKLEFRILKKEHPSGRRYLRSAVILLCGAIIFLFIPSAVFKVLEGWSYSSALYFSIISLSTIGFGDLVAGIGYAGSCGAFYRVMATIWLFLGLSWLSGVINCAQDNLQAVAKHFNEKPLLSRFQSKARQGEDSVDLKENRKAEDADDIEKQTENE